MKNLKIQRYTKMKGLIKYSILLTLNPLPFVFRRYHKGLVTEGELPEDFFESKILSNLINRGSLNPSCQF